MAEKDAPLPSQVTDSEWIWAIPFLKEEDDPGNDHNGGKWLLFFNDDKKYGTMLGIAKQDEAWRKIVKLVQDGILTNATTSTPARDKQDGGMKGDVIKCYTSNYNDLNDIRRSAIEIRKALGTLNTFYYKTNEDSKAGHYQHQGCYSVSLYKFNAKNMLFVKNDKGEYVLPETASQYRPTTLIPSKVKDKEWIWAREGDANHTVPAGGGKWIVVLDAVVEDKDGLTELDEAWQKVLKLVLQGELLTAQCATPLNAHSGNSAALLCQTSNCEDRAEVKEVADKIRKVLNVSVPFYYKTNADTKEQVCKITQPFSDIAKYKHDVKNQLFVKVAGVWRACK